MSSYLHGTSPQEQQRLSLLNDVLLNQACLRELSLRGDERIVDFGAGLGQFSRTMARSVPHGTVVGIERDPVQLAAALRLAGQHGESGLVDFRSGDVLRPELGVEAGSFDLAHARFILEHVGDPLTVVRAMVGAVRHGGRVVLADDDHGVMRLWPEPAGFNDLWAAYIRTYDRMGNDPFVGRRLVQLLVQAGAEPVRNHWLFFGGCAGMDTFPVLAANMAGVVRSARTIMLEMALVDEATFDATMDRYDAWARRPDAALWFAVAWAEGLRPQPA